MILLRKHNYIGYTNTKVGEGIFSLNSELMDTGRNIHQTYSWLNFPTKSLSVFTENNEVKKKLPNIINFTVTLTLKRILSIVDVSITCVYFCTDSQPLPPNTHTNVVIYSITLMYEI